MQIKTCPNCGTKYPHEECPKCNPVHPRQLTLEEHMARLTDTQVEFIFQSEWWEQGNKKARQACLDEYDKRIGLENWPMHIDKGI